MGLSTKDLAERMGWPRDTLVNFELGRRAITIERLQHIAAALHVPAAVLLLDDPRAITVLTHVLREPRLLADVQFFLDSLSDELPEKPE